MSDIKDQALSTVTPGASAQGSGWGSRPGGKDSDVGADTGPKSLIALRDAYDSDEITHPWLYENNDPWAPGGSDRHYFVALNPNTSRQSEVEVPVELYDYISELREMIERAIKAFGPQE